MENLPKQDPEFDGIKEDNLNDEVIANANRDAIPNEPTLDVGLEGSFEMVVELPSAQEVRRIFGKEISVRDLKRFKKSGFEDIKAADKQAAEDFCNAIIEGGEGLTGSSPKIRLEEFFAIKTPEVVEGVEEAEEIFVAMGNNPVKFLEYLGLSKKENISWQDIATELVKWDSDNQERNLFLKKIEDTIIDESKFITNDPESELQKSIEDFFKLKNEFSIKTEASQNNQLEGSEFGKIDILSEPSGSFSDYYQILDIDSNSSLNDAEFKALVNQQFDKKIQELSELEVSESVKKGIKEALRKAKITLSSSKLRQKYFEGYNSDPKFREASVVEPKPAVEPKPTGDDFVSDVVEAENNSAEVPTYQDIIDYRSKNNLGDEYSNDDILARIRDGAKVDLENTDSVINSNANLGGVDVVNSTVVGENLLKEGIESVESGEESLFPEKTSLADYIKEKIGEAGSDKEKLKEASKEIRGLLKKWQGNKTYRFKDGKRQYLKLKNIPEKIKKNTVLVFDVYEENDKREFVQLHETEDCAIEKIKFREFKKIKEEKDLPINSKQNWRNDEGKDVKGDFKKNDEGYEVDYTSDLYPKGLEDVLRKDLRAYTAKDGKIIYSKAVEPLILKDEKNPVNKPRTVNEETQIDTTEQSEAGGDPVSSDVQEIRRPSEENGESKPKKQKYRFTRNKIGEWILHAPKSELKKLDVEIKKIEFERNRLIRSLPITEDKVEKIESFIDEDLSKSGLPEELRPQVREWLVFNLAEDVRDNESAQEARNSTGEFGYIESEGKFGVIGFDEEKRDEISEVIQKLNEDQKMMIQNSSGEVYGKSLDEAFEPFGVSDEFKKQVKDYLRTEEEKMTKQWNNHLEALENSKREKIDKLRVVLQTCSRNIGKIKNSDKKDSLNLELVKINENLDRLDDEDAKSSGSYNLAKEINKDMERLLNGIDSALSEEKKQKAKVNASSSESKNEDGEEDTSLIGKVLNEFGEAAEEMEKVAKVGDGYVLFPEPKESAKGMARKAGRAVAKFLRWPLRFISGGLVIGAKTDSKISKGKGWRSANSDDFDIAATEVLEESKKKAEVVDSAVIEPVRPDSDVDLGEDNLLSLEKEIENVNYLSNLVKKIENTGFLIDDEEKLFLLRKIARLESIINDFENDHIDDQFFDEEVCAILGNIKITSIRDKVEQIVDKKKSAILRKKNIKNASKAKAETEGEKKLTLTEKQWNDKLHDLGLEGKKMKCSKCKDGFILDKFDLRDRTSNPRWSADQCPSCEHPILFEELVTLKKEIDKNMGADKKDKSKQESLGLDEKLDTVKSFSDLLEFAKQDDNLNRKDCDYLKRRINDFRSHLKDLLSFKKIKSFKNIYDSYLPTNPNEFWINDFDERFEVLRSEIEVKIKEKVDEGNEDIDSVKSFIREELKKFPK